MIIRIVRMHFTEAGVEEFLQIFNTNKEAIRNFPGCTHLELLKDLEDPATYTTLSYWNNTENLDQYRKSELFGKVWGRVKSLFAERTQAFSLEKFIEVEGK
jgi:heme-degrading monooxygenase HmoA